MADVPGYAALAESLNAQGLDVAAIKAALKAQKIETPSWGYANSGTRFKAFAWPGAARTTREKLDDAAMVHRMTGIAPSAENPPALMMMSGRRARLKYGARARVTVTTR